MVMPACGASSAELKIFGSRVTKMMMADVGPQFEQDSGYKLAVVTDVAAVMKRRIERASRSTSRCWSISRPTP